MARPINCRRIGCQPQSTYFKPKGIPLSDLEEIILRMDEFEAIRLADLEKLHQEDAAEKMKISRQTFGRIVNSARRKVADALVEGKALKIEGGEFSLADITVARQFECDDCRHSWEWPYGKGRPVSCPFCKRESIHRIKELAETPKTNGNKCD